MEQRHDPGTARPDAAAHRFLTSLDDPMARLAGIHGPVDFTLPSRGTAPPDHLGRLTLSIVGQVISTSAAARIHERLIARLGGEITAEALAQADESELRAVGLTATKARALRELGRELTTGSLRFAELECMGDDEATARLVRLRGLGPWSAQLFLLRSLGRPDVFPAGDLGLRRGIQMLDASQSLPSIREAAVRALSWRPYRSYAAKYLWLSYAAGRIGMDPSKSGNAGN